MVTFYANPNDEHEIWIEKAAFDGTNFRIWHYIFFCFSAFTVLVVLFCCCIRIRVPRTKQEIEADYHRKKLAEKFQHRLKSINNQDLDTLDLERALAIIQANYEKENKNNEVVLSASATSGAPDHVILPFEENVTITKHNRSEGLKKITNVMKVLQLPPKAQQVH